MADDLKNLAKRLPEFIEAVRQEAGGIGMQTQVGAPLRKPLQELYEKCLAELTEDERAELDRMIKKMRRALSSPPGAIVPP